MSERSSFVTEYVYCNKCFETLKEALICNEKYLTALAIPSWEAEGKELPIIAGKIGGLGPGDDYIFLSAILTELDLCHPVRVAFLGDNGKNTLFMVTEDAVEELDWVS